MRNYNENVNDYLSEELLGEVECNIGDDLPYIPFEETEANFCFLESINPVDDKWELVFRIENEFSGEKYRKNYTVSKGTRLELNTFDVPFMCFLPPDKIPVLVEVTDVSANSVSLNTVGVLQEYADEIDRQPADFELITAKITLPSKQEILEKLKSGFNKHLLSITYRPTEKTLVHMMLPHPEIKAKTSTGKNIVFKGTASFNIQLTEVKNELDPRLVNDDSYKSATDAINAFYDQIKFCVQMYGRVQPCVMKWC